MSELPKGWEQPKLKEVVQYKKGKKPKALNEAQKESFLPYVDIKAFEKNIIAKYAHEDDGVLAQPEDTLMVWDGARSGLVGKGVKGLIGSTLSRLIPKTENINRDYLHHYFVSQFSFINSNTKGTGIPHVDPAKLWDLDFPLPSLEEQKRIADKLDSVLAKVEAAQTRLDKIPTLLKRFRQSVLAATTSGELTKDWREENEVEGWQSIKVEDIVEKIEAGKNIKCQERPPESNEFGIIKISAVTWGTYNEEQSKTLNSNSLFLENRRIKVGDFLISRANTLELLGMPVIVHQVTKNLMLSDKVLRLVIDEVNKEWLNIFFRSPIGRKEIESKATGNQQSMRNIGQKALLGIDLQLPSESEKLEIVRCVNELFSNADLVEKQYKAAKIRLDKLTQSILAKAFRGELLGASDQQVESELEQSQCEAVAISGMLDRESI